jgi:D-alanyl-D-alanine carboxypeptidase
MRKSNRRVARGSSALLVIALATATVSCSDDDADSTDAAVETAAPEVTVPSSSAPEVTVPSSSAPEVSSPQGSFEEVVAAAAQGMLAAGSANGATAVHVAISDPQQGDVVVVEGTLSADGSEPASESDSLPIGSITKTFTATVVLELIEQGDVALDDTVEELLPDLAAELPDLAGITVEQLLTMTSGIADYLNVPNSVVAEIVADPTRVWEPEELIAAGVAAGVEPPGTPGYSTTNYIILQLVAETITGSPLEDLITERVTEPLGLTGAVLPPPEDTTLPDPHTHGYLAGGGVAEMAEDGATVEEGTETTDWNTSFTQGGGGMYATIGDLLRWAESTVGNTLLGDDLAQQRLETSPIPGGIDYGLGIFKIGTNWYGHEGEALGWEALAVTDPDTGVSVAIAMNGAGGQFLSFVGFLDQLYPEGDILATMMAAG